MKAEIIAVGTEIVIGDIVNTNAAYLSRSLASYGINVHKHVSVGDNRARLKHVLTQALQDNDLVIVTGGLGPTEDDLTKECAAEVMGKALYFDADSWQNIVQYFEESNRTHLMSENNKKQAYIPEGATILKNNHGTAPGILMTLGEKKMILLPGPPNEMQRMYQEYVVEMLAELSGQVFYSRYIRFYGIGESLLETQLSDILQAQSNPTMALYAKTGEVMMRVTASCPSLEQAKSRVENQIALLQERVGQYIYLIGDERISDSQSEMHHVVGQLLMEHNMTISVAESITGGQLVSKLIENSGISKVLIEGIVCYSNESKQYTLNVRSDTLKQYGAVSAQTAEEMALGVASRTNVACAIATTGIAGPTSDHTEKPIGLVYVGIYYKGQVKSYEFHFNGNRDTIRDKATIAALNELRKYLVKHC